MATPSYHFLRSPSSFLSLFLKPTLSLYPQTSLHTTFFTSLSSFPTRPLLFLNSLSFSSSSSLSFPQTTPLHSLNSKYKVSNDYDDSEEEDDEDGGGGGIGQEVEQVELEMGSLNESPGVVKEKVAPILNVQENIELASYDDNEEEDDEEEGEGGIGQELEQVELEVGNLNENRGVVTEKVAPSLTVKEKKEVASYAHGLGKKLKCQLVGKSGVTASVASSFIENLESNELLKIKIHRTCPGELPDVVKELEEATGSVVVGQIGRSVILYRPSLTKLKAEEKRRQNRRIFVRKELTLKPTFLKKGPLPRPSGRGRRGSSRV